MRLMLQDWDRGQQEAITRGDNTWRNWTLWRRKAPDPTAAAQTDDSSVGGAQIMALIIPVEIRNALIQR